MDRRSFLLQPGAVALLGALGSNALAVSRPRLQRDAAVERRIAEIVQAYDSQGNHRTATAGDIAAAEWLQAEIRAMGATPQLEAFPIDRVDPGPAYLDIGGRRIDGVPVFDAAFSGAEGVKGRLGALGSDAEIALVESDPYVLLEPQREQRSAVAEARKSKHTAAVILTRGSVPGLFLLNAIAFMSPSGPPMLQVSAVESERLKKHAASLGEITLHARASRTATRASNVVVRFAGRDASLPPLVVSTPRSGWWQCAGERGGGIACWLETIRAIAAISPEREVLFAAFSGHETLDPLRRQRRRAEPGEPLQRFGAVGRALGRRGARSEGPRHRSPRGFQDPAARRSARDPSQRRALCLDGLRHRPFSQPRRSLARGRGCRRARRLRVGFLARRRRAGDEEGVAGLQSAATAAW